MSNNIPKPVGKIERLAQWALWPTVTLSVVGVGMLLTSAAARVWAWFLPVYLFIGMPLVLNGFVADWTRLRRLWRYLRGEADDWT
ncbi:MAG: hypothetical protein EOO77_46730 [Oxalobacteraceae bacterium]|nr:MAG: hypothetical protein EOO77_46730 [Oxalobacteraceae bacterium]